MVRFFNAERMEKIKSPVIFGGFSGRMTGKTLNVLHAQAAQAYERNKQFIYLDLLDEPANTLDRRLGIFSDHNAINWADTSVNHNHPEFNLDVYYFNRKFFVIENYDTSENLGANIRKSGQLIGYYHILENAVDIKSIGFPNTISVIIDEFSDKIKKFPNFEHSFSHYISSIFRARTEGQVILMGNAADARNPLLNMLGIGGTQLKKYIDRKPFYNGMIYLEFFTLKGLRNNVFEKYDSNPDPFDYPPNSVGDERSFAEKVAYALGVDLDNIDIEDDSEFVSDNINKEYRDHVDLFIEGKGEYLSFTRLNRTLLAQSSKPKSYNRHAWMDSTLNKGFENKWIDDALNSNTPKIFEDANAKIKFKKLGGR